MNIRAALKTVLLPACLTTTEAMRKKLAEATVESTNPLVERAKMAAERFRKLGWTPGQISVFVEGIMIVAHGREALKKVRIETLLETPEPPTLDPLTVIIFEKDTVGHYNPLKTPFIVVSGKNRQVLSIDGDTTGNKFSHDDYRLATDIEIEECIDLLNEAQIRKILSDTTVFAPILATLLDTPDPTEKKTESAT